MTVSTQQSYPSGAQGSYPVPPATTTTASYQAVVEAWGTSGATEVTQTADLLTAPDLSTVEVL